MPDEEMDESSTSEEQEATEPEVEETQPEETAEGSEDDNEAEDSSDSEPDSDEEETVSASEADGQSEDDRNPLPPGLKKRLKKLTAQNRANERLIAELEAKINQPRQEELMKEPEEPKLDECATVEEFNEKTQVWKKEHTAWAKRQAIIEQEMEKKQKAEEANIQSIRDNWFRQEANLKQTAPTFDTTKYLRTVQPTREMEYLLGTSEIGPHVLNYLYENPDEADSLRAMPQAKMVREFTKLETRLSTQVKGIKKKPAQNGHKGAPYVKGTATSPVKPKTAAETLYG